MNPILLGVSLRHSLCLSSLPIRSIARSTNFRTSLFAGLMSRDGWDAGGELRVRSCTSSSRGLRVARLFCSSVDSLLVEDAREGIPLHEVEEEEVEGDAPHVPVLLKEVVGYFEGRRLLNYVDCTLGAGGHACAVLSAHPEMETFIGLDVDPTAHAEAQPRLQQMVKALSFSSSSPKLHFIRTNFRNIKTALRDLSPDLLDRGVDGILMDLGMSSMQVNEGERGFSFMREGPVDMRMDPTASLKAEEILNTWPEAEVGRILRDYGDERRWRHIARKIVQARLSGGIHTTSKLVEVIGGSSFTRTGKGGRLKPGLHPATRSFQALRIAVNDELKALEVALSDAFSCLSSGGRLQVISFHSLEDRMVKQFFLNAAGLQKQSGEGDTQEYTHIPGETRHSKYIRKKSVEAEFGERLRKREKCPLWQVCYNLNEEARWPERGGDVSQPQKQKRQVEGD
ncbi:hypothetical protein R1flu_019746 [Riccia fluitans]|uniref:MraW methylase family protein n=1 Tax=Riccia fluitans TaxID=41844 RepID=A0ABD1ZJS0_9MARC